MIKVIINTDDLGLNYDINEKFDEAFKKVHITYATILAASYQN